MKRISECGEGWALKSVFFCIPGPVAVGLKLYINIRY